MIKFFSEEVDSTVAGEKSAIRALQVWQNLICKTDNRQTVKYIDLARKLGYSDGRPLSYILGHIMYFCQQNELPPLTILVVNKEGTPGEGFTDTAADDFQRRREDVFSYDWYSIIPPSVSEFKKAWENAKNSERNRL